MFNSTGESRNSIRRVLLAEDELDARHSMGILLSNAGFEVETAGDGVEALQTVLSRRESGELPQLLIMDILMPRMDGVQLLSELESRGIQMPTLAITGYGNKDMLADLLRLGCCGYLDKPFSPEEFLASIQMAIERGSVNRDEAQWAIRTGGTAHDLKNHLHVAAGNLELLRPMLEENPRTLELVDDASEAVARASGLSRQLITEVCGTISVRRKEILADLVREACDLPGGWNAIKLDVQVPDELWPISANRLELVRALGNLLSNARDAMPDGGNLLVRAENMVPDKTVRLLGVPAYLHLMIKDTGCGVAPTISDDLFKPGFSTKNSGTGMGLYVTREIIRQHGGHMDFQSTPGEGTQIDIFLPAANTVSENDTDTLKNDAAPADRLSDTREDFAAETPEDTGQTENVFDLCPRILVLDACNEFGNSLGRILAPAGYTIVSFSDEKAAFSAYQAAWRKKHPFDAVVLDLRAYNLELTHRLRESNTNVRIVISSAYHAVPGPSELSAAGVAAVMTTPFKPDKVLETMEKVLAS